MTSVGQGTSAQERPRTLGALRASGWTSRSVKDEIRDRLVSALGAEEALFDGIVGYRKTVLPQVENALLSRHDLILLGLRGQAKTRIARGMVDLLDEWIPVIDGSPLHEDPLAPITATSKRRIAEMGDDLPIAWRHRSERFQEKLATPDINMADLIGDLDPIKAASEKRSLMDPEVIQFGLLPQSNRGIFVINELPDLPTRIQVGLFNILEEKDVQIRGFPLRMPLDVLLVFTANPEDYTNRGSIVTPLRDRIRSQIHTHYPTSLEDGMTITAQEAWVDRSTVTVHVPRLMREAVEETAIQARTSSFVDQSSGVSARVTIALMENLVSNAERRALRGGETTVTARPVDLYAALPGLAGKIELVFEGEQEGPLQVCRHLLGKALKAVFDRAYDDPYADGEGGNRYDDILAHFRTGVTLELSEDEADGPARDRLSAVPGLVKASTSEALEDHEQVMAMELVLEGLHQSSLLGKKSGASVAEFRDQFDEMAEGLNDA